MTDSRSDLTGSNQAPMDSAKPTLTQKQTQASSSERVWLVLIGLAFVVLHVPTFKYLWDRWEHDTQYSLAYLVPFVSGYFAWKLWKEAIAQECGSSPWGTVLILASMLFHLAGTVIDVSILSAVSMLMFFVGACIYLRGAKFTRVLWFPLAYTFFMIPIPEGLIDIVGFPMQLWASAGTAKLLGLLNIEVIRNGVNMSVPGFNFEVAAACSGMSSLVALVGVSAVFAYISGLPSKYKWALFALSLPIALIANVVRITTIALVGYFISASAAMNVFHDWSSPILFVIAIILLFAISRGFEWLNDRRTTP